LTLPSNGNNGGILGEIPVLTGNKDSVKSILQVVSKNAPRYNEDKKSFIPIEQSDTYKMMPQEKQQQVSGLYISKEPIVITKKTATYQNGGNGIMNDKGLAVSNVLQQTGVLAPYIKDKTQIVEATIFYNPSRGMLADSLETTVDMLGGTTGIAKQAGEFTRDVSTVRAEDGSNFIAHSQFNELMYSGIGYINSDAYKGLKFMPQDYFISKKELDLQGNKKDGIPTFISFGSPKNGEDMNRLIGAKKELGGLGYKYMGAFTNKHDYVGQGLGGNSGVKGQASILQKLNVVDMGRLITPSSPHSGYDPYKFKELKNVIGYKK
jgi:hypothetical protein